MRTKFGHLCGRLWAIVNAGNPWQRYRGIAHRYIERVKVCMRLETAQFIDRRKSQIRTVKTLFDPGIGHP